MPDLVVSLGSINIDIAAYSEVRPRPGGTVLASRYAIGLGGKGANQASPTLAEVRSLLG